ncbi:MAG: flagellar basal body L-ring protein FlgH [Bacteriovoracia bacterium]
MRLGYLTRNSLVLVILATTTGCGSLDWIREWREEARDENTVSQKRYTASRRLAGVPATVEDNREQMISGTPVDLSGTRLKNKRITKEDFIIESAKNENSLWNDDGQTNFFFVKNKIKMPGDLVTVVIEDDLRKDMVEEFRKLLPPEYRKAKYRVPGLSKADVKKEGSTPGSEAPTEVQNSRDLASEDKLTAEVLERYPNGNLRIRGIKRVPFRKKDRDVEVTAIVRSADVADDDSVKSSRFFEHKVDLYQ